MFYTNIIYEHWQANSDNEVKIMFIMILLEILKFEISDKLNNWTKLQR